MAMWQVQEAKQRFSEVLRRVKDEGPQIITRHGEEIAVIIDMSEYRHCTGKKPDFDEFLLTGPKFSDEFLEELEKIVRERRSERPRDIDFLFEE
jgi:prevent-host-death family protein